MMNALHPAWMTASRGMLLCAALAAPCGAAWAEKADKNKPLNLESDTMVHDEARQVSIMEGSVILTKGTIVIRAQRVEVRKDAAENQFLLATAKENERVLFRVKREGLDEFMEGEAAKVEYDSKADVAILSGRAVMRRLRGATLADESVGNVIVFNNASETLIINGIPATAKTPGQRVRIMLSSKEDKSSAPTPTGGVASPALRPSVLAK
jgi:lipopolysaccharide export system protein LptA